MGANRSGVNRRNKIKRTIKNELGKLRAAEKRAAAPKK